jgi:hypothetical protein
VDASNIVPHFEEDQEFHDDYVTCAEIMRNMSEQSINEILNLVRFFKTIDESHIAPQSMSVEQHQILSMEGEVPEQVVAIPSNVDETRKFADKSDNSLGGFLSRPLKIAEFTWTPSVDFYQKFDPWTLFIENKRNVNRMNNFKMFRAKLKIKILVNGNSFYYGRLMACYQPFEQLDTLTANAALVPEDNVQMSQFPRIFIDPTTSQGGEMELPFFWPYDYCSLLDESYNYLGALTIRQLTALKHTSGDTSLSNQINVSVYAWMEDIALEAPTATNISTIVPQSEKDERKDAIKGPVEKIATAVEAVTSSLARVPLLAPYATPAQVGASAIKGVASKFGWCSPSIIDPPKPYKPQPCSNTAVTNGADTSQKLTIDGKQEVTVDPRTIGLGTQDELEISYISSRESYLTNFAWNLTTAAESHLFSVRVDPMLYDLATVGGKVTTFLTAMAGASMPFQYWNGTIKIRFQIVASTFHRGRLAIVYDPNSSTANREDNVAYTEIIDIASCRDFTISIGPNQESTLIPRLAFNGAQVPFSTSPMASIGDGNGVISAYVLNELTIPNTGTSVNNDISVNVFVSTGDDFEVFVPDSEFTSFVIKPQSETVDESQVSESYQTPEMSMALSVAMPNRNLIYSGEQIKSFRALLKRYYPWRGVYLPNNAAATDLYRIEHCSMPSYRGNVTGALDTRTGPAAYSYVTTTLLNFLLPAFQAYRGSIRWKGVKRSGSAYDVQANCTTVSLNFDGRYSSTSIDLGINSNAVARSSVSEADSGTMPNGGHSTVIFANSVNPIIEYELPWYARERFSPGKRTNYTTQVRGNLYPQVGATIDMDAFNSSAAMFQLYCAAGEDFSMYFFTGWPRMYFETTLPTAA